jgi:nucleoside-diphosphate-sugar epimerase
MIASMSVSASRRDGRLPVLSPDKVKELSCPYWVSSSRKARDTIGFAPQFELSEALSETYRWYLDQDWLE